MLYGDGASSSLSDAVALARAKPVAPKHLYQARLQIRKFHILSVVTLDISHAFCVAIETYYNRYLAIESRLHQLQQEDFLLPTKLMKRFYSAPSGIGSRPHLQAKYLHPTLIKYLMTMRVSALGHHYSLCH